MGRGNHKYIHVWMLVYAYKYVREYTVYYVYTYETHTYIEIKSTDIYLWRTFNGANIHSIYKPNSDFILNPETNLHSKILRKFTNKMPNWMINLD